MMVVHCIPFSFGKKHVYHEWNMRECFIENFCNYLMSDKMAKAQSVRVRARKTIIDLNSYSIKIGIWVEVGDSRGSMKTSMLFRKSK